MKTQMHLSLATMFLATFALTAVATAADYEMILIEPLELNARESTPLDINEFGDVRCGNYIRSGALTPHRSSPLAMTWRVAAHNHSRAMC